MRTGVLPLAAPDDVRRAHPDRRRRPRAGAEFGAAVQRAAAAAAKVDRTSPDGERVTQFELLTAAAFDELARRGVEVAVVEAGLGGRYDATNVLGAGSSCSPTSGSSTRAGSARRSPTSRARSSRSCRPDATLVLGDDAPEVVALAEATGATIVRARRRSRSTCPATSARTSPPRAAAASAILGRPRDDLPRRGLSRPRAPAGRRPRPADDPRRRPQPARDRRARRVRARRARWPSCRSSTTRTRRRCCARCCRA